MSGATGVYALCDGSLCRLWSCVLEVWHRPGETPNLACSGFGIKDAVEQVVWESQEAFKGVSLVSKYPGTGGYQ